jgi:hypothetical protein
MNHHLKLKLHVFVVSPCAENEATARAGVVGILPSAATFTRTTPGSATAAARADALVGAVGASSNSETEIKGRRLSSLRVRSIGECHCQPVQITQAGNPQPGSNTAPAGAGWRPDCSASV